MSIGAMEASERMKSLWIAERDWLIAQCENCIDARPRFAERQRKGDERRGNLR